MSFKETIDNACSPWMEGNGPEADIVISSRVRVARDLAQFPFPHLLSQEKADQVIHAVNLAVENKELVEEVGELELNRLAELLPLERQILVEKHLISPDLLINYQDKAVALREDEIISIMINEEDHLRIQCLLPGFQLMEAWQLINKVDSLLQKTIDCAFSERLGYLTACPTNVGTGLRASVMLHLPGLVMVNQINEVLTAISKLGLTVRGRYGEGTEATGNFFQVSNQITLGQTEDEIIRNLISVVKQLLLQERNTRNILIKEGRERLEDRVNRALGILKYACIISSEEAIRLFSDVRLGIDLKIIPAIPPSLINELMVLIRPAYLLKLAEKEMNPFQRDVYRAELIRKKLKDFS